MPPSGKTLGKRIEKLNLEASLPGFDAPLTFDTEAVFDGKPVAVAGSIGSFGGLLGGTATPVSLAIAAPTHLPDKIDFSGTATYASGTLLLNPFSAKAGDKSMQGAALYKDGTLTLKPFTLKTAEGTVQGNATYKDGLVTVSPFTAQTADAVVQGSATYKDNILNLPKFTAKAYGNAFSGALAADLSGKVPAVNAALAADTVNVDALLARSGGSKAKSSGGGGAPGGGGAGWSDAAINFSPAPQDQRQAQAHREDAGLRQGHDQPGQSRCHADRREAQRAIAGHRSLWRQGQRRACGRCERQDPGTEAQARPREV